MVAGSHENEANVNSVRDGSVTQIPWHEKYRWKSLDDIIGQDDVMTELKEIEKMPVEKRPHMLFIGPYGIGKTTAAYAFGKNMYQIEYDASELGVELGRRLRERLSSRNSIEIFLGDGDMQYAGVKIILTEADSLTKDARKVLRTPLETKLGTTKVILTANDISAFDKGFLDRFRIFEFHALSKHALRKLANKLIVQENVTITEQDLGKIIDGAMGDARNVIDDLERYNTIHRVVDRTNQAESPPKCQGKEWMYWKVIERELSESRNGGPTKWVTWDTISGLPCVIVQFGPKIIQGPIPLKINLSMYPNGVLEAITRYRDSVGKEFVKVHEKTYDLQRFLDEYADGRKTELRFAVECLPTKELPPEELELQSHLETTILHDHCVDPENSIEKGIIVYPSLNKFKIVVDYLRAYLRNKNIDISVERFARDYGYTKNTTTMMGKDVPCVYGKFQKVNAEDYIRAWREGV